MSRELYFFEHVPDGKTLYIYGAGAMGEFVFDRLIERGFPVAGFIDSSRSGELRGLRVWTLDEYAPTHGADKAVLVASQFSDEIAAALAARGIDDWFDLSPTHDAVNPAYQTLRYMSLDDPRLKGPRGKMSTLEIVERTAQARGAASRRLAVNLGCNDGEHGDPCFPLFQAGYGGLCVDVIKTSNIFQNLPSRNVIKQMGFQITPMNIVPLLRRAGMPEDIDMLKIDIDSIDGVILSELLAAGYRPSVIQMEVNNEVPPPFKFAALYHRLYHSHNSAGSYGFYGCSLGYVAEVAGRYGYELLQLDFIKFRDAILVRREFLDLFPPRAFSSPREAFLNEPNYFSHMFSDFGIDVSAWKSREDYHVLAGEIWNAFTLASQARFGISAPFHFSL